MMNRQVRLTTDTTSRRCLSARLVIAVVSDFSRTNLLPMSPAAQSRPVGSGFSRTKKGRVALALLVALWWSAPLHLHGGEDLGREVLANDDGWAAFGGGTTGGASAAPGNVFVVTNRQGLIAALNDGIYPPPSSGVSPNLAHGGLPRRIAC